MSNMKELDNIASGIAEVTKELMYDSIGIEDYMGIYLKMYMVILYRVGLWCGDLLCSIHKVILEYGVNFVQLVVGYYRIPTEVIEVPYHIWCGAWWMNR